MRAKDLIEEQQKGHENTPVFYVGEQLKDMCREDPACDQLMAEDLAQPGHGIADAEKKIKEYARAHGGCTPPQEADRILREFYGLPGAGQKEERKSGAGGLKVVKLSDLL